MANFTLSDDIIYFRRSERQKHPKAFALNATIQLNHYRWNTATIPALRASCRAAEGYLWHFCRKGGVSRFIFGQNGE
jgi:hypothetical protein